MLLFFDTETSDEVQKGLPPWAEGNARIVQLAALLCNDDGGDENIFAAIIKPDGWRIIPKFETYHGITNERAEAVGIPIKTALSAFRWFARPAKRFVAHSANFDRDRVNGELHRAGVDSFEVQAKDCFCTMLGMMDVCKIPLQRKWGDQKFKWPSLEEATQHAFGESVEGAHNALKDVIACKRLYFWMKAQGITPAL